jgi:glycosyltransferase involved in cell wall biosynthesis
MVRELIHSFQPDVVLTVAQGWWYMQAGRVARQFNLPLVTFFHDWWPDFPDVPMAFRSQIEREFRRICAESAVAICVSDGMLRELGEPQNALVIHPVPSLTNAGQCTPNFSLPLRVVYFGNLREYGPLIENALRASQGSKQVRLEVFGAGPLWTPGAEDYFRSCGFYHGFVPRNQFVESLRHSQAVLVVMSFAAALRRRMTTSFPSKMIDATQLGLPVIVWGPEYCSAVQWARQGDRALCVTDSNPSVLREVLEDLAASSSEQERLAKAARAAAARDFNPERIETQFIDALERVI